MRVAAVNSQSTGTSQAPSGDPTRTGRLYDGRSMEALGQTVGGGQELPAGVEEVRYEREQRATLADPAGPTDIV